MSFKVTLGSSDLIRPPDIYAWWQLVRFEIKPSHFWFAAENWRKGFISTKRHWEKIGIKIKPVTFISIFQRILVKMMWKVLTLINYSKWQSREFKTVDSDRLEAFLIQWSLRIWQRFCAIYVIFISKSPLFYHDDKSFIFVSLVFRCAGLGKRRTKGTFSSRGQIRGFENPGNQRPSEGNSTSGLSSSCSQAWHGRISCP